MSYRACNNYLNENCRSYVVEYRGNFEEQIEKVDYACGEIVTDTLAVISVPDKDIDRLRKDVPSIIFVEAKSIYTLQDISPSDIDNIYEVSVNPYLNLRGTGVLVGIIDSGIDYLNPEFIREDDTTRIIKIWDQSIGIDPSSNLYIGKVYTEEEINNAIKAKKSGGNPYEIVPSRDEVGHGTKMAGIIGARGYNGKMTGVANNCDFVVVKLLQSPCYTRTLQRNNLPIVPAYNNSDVLSAIEFLRKTAEELDRPIVIYLGVGTSQGAHDGYNITSRFITSISNKSGVIFVAGTGNLGNAETHVTNYIKNIGEVDEVQLNIPRQIEEFEFYIWIHRPNSMSLSIVSPEGDEEGYFIPEIFSSDTRKFYLTNTEVEVKGYNPENFTGHQIYILRFTSIKPGIWKFRLKGEYIIDGRYDIWLQDKILLPPGTKFLNPNPYNTLTIPSTARKVITVAYYSDITESVLAESGKGFNTNYLINPDIATVGTNILTVTGEEGQVISVSGSSAATAVIAGACALLLQWAVVDKNDLTINTTKIRSLFIYAARREPQYDYPNQDIGYGKFDFLKVFNILSGNYRSAEEYKEYYVGNLYVRVPEDSINYIGVE